MRTSYSQILLEAAQSPLLVAIVFVVGLCPVTFGVEPSPGQRGQHIFNERCVSCHGPHGEGTEDHYPKRLVGDRPIADLANVISETMPEEDPESVIGEDAMDVARFIYDAFYSRAAQVRNHPPRIELSRLTNSQYRNAVADLIASFSWRKNLGPERGLKAEYFNEKDFRGDKKAFERIDPVIDFDFSEGTPDAKKITNEDFSMRWNGSLIVPDTGEYEFILSTQNGARFWINDDNVPAIDKWVRSGDDTDFRVSRQLLGGRVYPIRVEFFTFKEKAASIHLRWKPPHQLESTIPERHLIPDRFPETFVVTTPFPPDDRSRGWETGMSVSKAWDEATTAAAIEVAEYAERNLRRLTNCKQDDPERPKKLRQFCTQFAERAIRHPLSDDMQAMYIDRRFDSAPSDTIAVKRSVLLALKSPRFLYHEVDPERDAFDTAARLSFAIWDSIPDTDLTKAAGAGRLAKREQVAKQAERMIGDPRSNAKLYEFLQRWTRLDQIHDISKNSEQFPGFDPHIASDLRVSLTLSLQDVLDSESCDFRNLLLADRVYFNGRLAAYYGVELAAEADFQRVAFEPDRRSGVVSHPYLLAGLAYHASSSPIHRGVFLARNLLGRSLQPPADAVTPIPPELHPDLTTRQRIELQTDPEACRTCHNMINPLGFSLENFDAVGRFRTTEADRDVDASGSYATIAGPVREFSGAKQLAEFLVDCRETHAAFVEQLFHHAVKQPVAAYGPETLDRLTEFFESHEFNIRRLLVEIAIVSATPAQP